MIRKLAAYVILGINTGGVKDILIICADGLSGIKEAIAAAFPKKEYQRCICTSGKKHAKICSR